MADTAAFSSTDLANPVIQEMLGVELVDALTAARTRLGDATIMARCEAGLWLLERAGEPVVTGLAWSDAVEAASTLA